MITESQWDTLRMIRQYSNAKAAAGIYWMMRRDWPHNLLLIPLGRLMQLIRWIKQPQPGPVFAVQAIQPVSRPPPCGCCGEDEGSRGPD